MNRCLDIFYNNIIKEALNGRIDSYFMYNVIFNTNIENKQIYNVNSNYGDIIIPTLTINNKKQFDDLLIEYVNVCLNYYDDSFFEEEILNDKLYDDNKTCKEKTILALLFANATIDDFKEPCDFLRRRISFIENTRLDSINIGYSELLNTDLVISIKKDIINNETPSKFVLKTTDNYTFPEIKFGIYNNIAYIYAIQNIQQESNKSINRKLYKIGEGFDDKADNYSLYGIGNLKDITPSFLLAANVFIAYLHSINIDNIVVSSILLERWNSKKITNYIKYKNNKIDENTYNELNNIQVNIQSNLTEKLLRTFLRLKYHYSGIDITAYPFDIDSNLHLSVTSLDNCNNNLLLETSRLINNNRINYK